MNIDNTSRIGIPSESLAAKDASATGTCTPASTLELQLASVATVDELPRAGESAIIVALVNSDLHVRIFEPDGKRVLDKAEAKLASGQELTALKELLQVDPFPQAAELSEEARDAIAELAIAVSGYPEQKWEDHLFTPPRELHACMGLNACKGHDYYGSNDCAGMGKCATQQHYCHTLNNCKGQGGCGLYGSSEEVCTPGENDCAFQGSCGTPIPASRYVTQGPNKGESVWQIARKLFEKRMAKSRRNVGDSPMRYGPTLEYLRESYNSGSSCGYSGAKYCSFVSDLEAKERHRAFTKATAKGMPQILQNCNEDECC